MYADDMDTSDHNDRSQMDTGKWKHDKFDELEQDYRPVRRTNNRFGGGNSKPKNLTTSQFRSLHKKESRVDPREPVTLLISNLAETVSQEDIDELFLDFKPTKTMLHHDSAGKSLGTATVEVVREEMEKLKKAFSNVRLDGNVMSILETNAGSSGSAKKGSVFSRIQKVESSSNKFKTSRVPSIKSRVSDRALDSTVRSRSAGHEKRRSPFGQRSQKRGGSGSGTGRAPRRTEKKKTVEELDAELEAYMKA